MNHQHEPIRPTRSRKARYALVAAIWLLPFRAFAGLDITAFEKLTLVLSPRLGEDGEPLENNQVKLAPVELPERFAGLEPGKVYQFRSFFEFRAGSYSGYNAWRNELAKLAGYEQTSVKSSDGKMELRYDATVWNGKKGPFWELIDFSDAEGVIGPVVCKRVHKDFLQFQAIAAKHPDQAFRTSYEDWTKAFAMCANDGAIVFH